MADLAQVLRQLPKPDDPNLLVGLDTADDAGVYALDGDTALVQTVDFFPPIVDDPYTFGQITAANALSDIYAMGAKPMTALNIVGFPIRKLDISILSEILTGGQNKLTEAKVALLGGHTVDDSELKFGLAITGTVSRRAIITNSGARPGDSLILTKPLGIGIITTAHKAGLVSDAALGAATKVMLTLNNQASLAMIEVGVNACTDVTGFGLLGHAHEMALASGVSLEISAHNVPVLAATYEYARQGLVPGGARTNRSYLDTYVRYDPQVSEDDRIVFCDPQTSGGLLISVPREREALLLATLRRYGVDGHAIGHVSQGTPGGISVT